MSPASKSKMKDKKAHKELLKSSKTSSHVNTSSGISASGFDPISGTFHTFEKAPVPPVSPLHVNGRFRNIDETDDHNGYSSVNGIEYDSISNNDSWSGESEDHKDKTSQPSQRLDSIPGADNDKREKIRLKNERKHQRQKERRAQELHEKCSGYLKSMKIEALADKLEAMGFSREHATVALIVNEGRVEETISWFFEGGQEHENMEQHKEKLEQYNLDGGANLNIDISEELARITDIEFRYKVSKQEVERSVVSCKGDLYMAEEMLKAQREDQSSASTNPEENGVPLTVANGKLPISSVPSRELLQKRDDKELNYAKAPATVVSSSVDPVIKPVHMLKKIPTKPDDGAKPQQNTPPSEKRYQAPTKKESCFVSVGNELKNLQLGSVKEPLVLQWAQPVNPKQTPSTSLFPSPSISVETAKVAPSISNGPSSNPLQTQLHYSSNPQFMSRSVFSDSQGFSNGNGFGAIASASSVGPFSTGIGANGLSPSVDWNTGGSVSQFDYTSIDWSLDPGTLSSRLPSRLWTCASYSLQNKGCVHDTYAYGVGRPMRQVLPNGTGASQEGAAAGNPINVVGSRDWSSPFEEKDLFSLPRQFVSSPTP